MQSCYLGPQALTLLTEAISSMAAVERVILKSNHITGSKYERGESYWRGIDPARPLETAFPYARGVARRGVARAYVACWGCKAHLGGPTQAGLQGYLVSSVRCPQGVTAMDTRNEAFEIFRLYDLLRSPSRRKDAHFSRPVQLWALSEGGDRGSQGYVCWRRREFIDPGFERNLRLNTTISRRQ